MTLTSEQMMAAKGQGFISQKDKGHFTCRVVGFETVQETMLNK